ncbi:MAG TPA: prolyl oligopeptidase family serine peptidase [Steroidobacteraceae bacterium]|nr:prolyl oligopeptidase family serine peptidase [Steroidobacteraceae bacterium]
MNRINARVVCIFTALALTACGGGNSGSATGGTSAVAVSPPRGTLVQNPPVLLSTITTPDVLVELSTLTNTEVLTLGGTLLCDVAVYHLEYTTVGGANEATTASGAMMVPTGIDSSCHGAHPMMLYAHGTTTDRDFNLADLQVQKNAESYFMAFFASQGYIVVAPNYAGYDTSTLSYHPYLVAEQQSKDMIDALTAARSALPTAAAPLTTDSGRLFITGYSQGGYVAMATHRAMQSAGMTVTASAPMSGPYALAAFVDAVFFGRVNGSAPVSSVLLVSAYQESYGNIYASATDVFEAQYASGIESLLPSTMTRSELYVQGKLPMYALFSATPPAPEFADITPATTPADLAPVFAIGFGTGNLVLNSYRFSYLLDAQANPDGGWPTTTTGMAAATPGLPLRQALQLNDLRNWTPTAPILLCGGDADPTVFWLNTQLMQGYWASHAPVSTPISVLDLDSPASPGDTYADLKRDFALAKELIAATAVAQGATDGGAAAVDEAYHAPLVPPFCLAAVRSFFAAQ